MKRYQTPLRVALTKDGDDGYKFKLAAGGRSLVVDLDDTADAAVDLWLDLDQADAIVDEFGGVEPGDDEDSEESSTPTASP